MHPICGGKLVSVSGRSSHGSWARTFRPLISLTADQNNGAFPCTTINRERLRAISEDVACRSFSICLKAAGYKSSGVEASVVVEVVRPSKTDSRLYIFMANVGATAVDAITAKVSSLKRIYWIARNAKGSSLGETDLAFTGPQSRVICHSHMLDIGCHHRRCRRLQDRFLL
jgi:hypothetical protein